MDLKHFGDAYDIVKKSLLHWMAPLGPWGVHPMFTHPVSKDQATSFSRFLSVPLLATDVLELESDRPRYFAACGACRSIFLDPDTGVRLHRRERHRATEFVFDDELVTLAQARPEGVVMVFDQSVPRGSEAKHAQAKLDHFALKGLAGFAYVSQACFLVLAASPSVADEARGYVLNSSALPEARVLSTTPATTALHPTAAVLTLSRRHLKEGRAWTND